MKTIVYHEIAGTVHMSISRNGVHDEKAKLSTEEFEAYRAAHPKDTFIHRREAVGAIPATRRDGDELEG
jgi:hypothetical protein